MTSSWLALGEGALYRARPSGIKARALLDALRAQPHVRDVVMTEEHVCIYFEPHAPPSFDWDLLVSEISNTEEVSAVRHVVRVRYDGEDIQALAEQLGLSLSQIVEMHANANYRVRMIGFLPGFAYLGELHPRLICKRRPTPRARVPKGAVGIGGKYTGIYPCSSAGGWHLIGSAAGFEPFGNNGQCAFGLGDIVSFEPSP